uniref:Uncharacterized protein n=1 Tax=Rousettus aegyptiacus TaxID=9407 RepID=A0A7J8DY14_ROUAE|nr:hypothetical protein HJG63_008431 [Rousettus aegyptiacus]
MEPTPHATLIRTEWASRPPKVALCPIPSPQPPLLEPGGPPSEPLVSGSLPCGPSAISLLQKRSALKHTRHPPLHAREPSHQHQEDRQCPPTEDSLTSLPKSHSHGWDPGAEVSLSRPINTSQTEANIRSAVPRKRP